MVALPDPTMKLSDRAFTLPELLLAAAILAVVVTGMLSLFVSCLFLNENNRNLTVASSHAQYIMEEIKNTDFMAIKSKADNGDWDWCQAGDFSDHSLAYLNSECVDTQVNWQDAPSNTLLDVVVQVNWQDRGGRQRVLSLETFFVES